MELAGEYRIPAPAPQVWDALNDAAVLQACIPGCRELQRRSDTEFAAVVATKVGPISAVFKGQVRLTDLDPPRAYTLTGEGQGGAAGFARMSARVALAEDLGETLLRYDAQAEVGGKLASVGSRLVQAVAKKNADEFFKAFAERMGGQAVIAPLPPSEPTATIAQKALIEVAAPPPRPMPLWVIALIAGACGVVLGFMLGRL